MRHQVFHLLSVASDSLSTLIVGSASVRVAKFHGRLTLVAPQAPLCSNWLNEVSIESVVSCATLNAQSALFTINHNVDEIIVFHLKLCSFCTIVDIMRVLDQIVLLDVILRIVVNRIRPFCWEQGE